MVYSDTYGIGPARAFDLSEHAQIVERTLEWLERQQNRDGSWGGKSIKERGLDHEATTLDQVVTTCQVLMTFLAAGYPASEDPVRSGMAWLTRNPAATHQAFYWRIGPLLRIPKYHDVVGRDIKFAEDMYSNRQGRISHHLLPFLIKANTLNGTPATEPKMQRYLQEAVRALEQCLETTPASSPAEKTSYLMAVVSDYELPGTDNLIQKSKDTLTRLVHPEGGNGLSWDGQGTNTAFVIMNLADSKVLRNDAGLVSLMKQAVEWLIVQRIGSQWPTEKGDVRGHDLRSSEYFTAINARGILAYECVLDPNFPLQILWLRHKRFTSRITRLNLFLGLCIILIGALLIVLAWLYHDAIINLVGPWGPFVGYAVGGVLAILAFLANLEGLASFMERVAVRLVGK